MNEENKTKLLKRIKEIEKKLNDISKLNGDEIKTLSQELSILEDYK
jgi:hypothetical protein